MPDASDRTCCHRDGHLTRLRFQVGQPVATTRAQSTPVLRPGWRQQPKACSDPLVVHIDNHRGGRSTVSRSLGHGQEGTLKWCMSNTTPRPMPRTYTSPVTSSPLAAEPSNSSAHLKALALSSWTGKPARLPASRSSAPPIYCTGTSSSRPHAQAEASARPTGRSFTSWTREWIRTPNPCGQLVLLHHRGVHDARLGMADRPRRVPVRPSPAVPDESADRLMISEFDDETGRGTPPHCALLAHPRGDPSFCEDARCGGLREARRLRHVGRVRRRSGATADPLGRRHGGDVQRRTPERRRGIRPVWRRQPRVVAIPCAGS